MAAKYKEIDRARPIPGTPCTVPSCGQHHQHADAQDTGLIKGSGNR